MKKKITLLISVFTVAVLLFVTYFVFFRTNDTELNKYATLDENTLSIKTLDFNKVTIAFADERETLEKNSDLKLISDYARSFEYNLKNIEVVYGEGSEFCTVSCGENKKTLEKQSFFVKLPNGVNYIFNGERLFAVSVLELTENTDYMEAESFPIKAINGYDLDGDTVLNAGGNVRPFVFPKLERKDVDSITVTNESGRYKAYRINNAFYFEGAELCKYDENIFSAFMVNCTYMLAIGKYSDVPKADLAKYGLDSEENASAVVEVKALNGEIRKVLIGKKVASGVGYYAKESTKPHVYVIDSSIEDNVLKPVTDMLIANLGYNIGDSTDIVDITDILLMYNYGENNEKNTTIYVKQRYDVGLPANIKGFNEKQEIGSLIFDKLYFTGDYSDWTGQSNLFGFKSTDGKEIDMTFFLERYAKDGNYSVKFGLVKDTSKGAVLPEKVAVYVKDKESQKYVSVGELTSFEQSEKSYRQYEISFEHKERLTDIKLEFTLPSGNVYTVLDEVTVYADGVDSTPKEALSSLWKIVSPENYIKDGYNYATPDTTTFSKIVQGMAFLVGDKVVAYNVTDKETLKKYGLDNPEIGLSYDFNGYRSYISFSKADENKNRYVYATIEYTNKKGENTVITTGIIALVSEKTAPWLSWEPLEFLNRSTFMMYIDKIDSIELEFEGKNHVFVLEKSSDGKVSRVLYEGRELDLENFRYLYVSMMSVERAGEYVTGEGEEKTPCFRMKINSKVKGTEIIYYRVTSSKVIYETDGMPSNYYVLYSDISNIIKNVKLLLDGKDVPR